MSLFLKDTLGVATVPFTLQLDNGCPNFILIFGMHPDGASGDDAGAGLGHDWKIWADGGGATG